MRRRSNVTVPSHYGDGDLSGRANPPSKLRCGAHHDDTAQVARVRSYDMASASRWTVTGVRLSLKGEWHILLLILVGPKGGSQERAGAFGR